MICGFSSECKISLTFDKGVVEVHDTSGIIWEVITPINYSDLVGGGKYLGRMWVHHHINERGQVLYGFPDKDSYQSFLELMTVDGIGPSASLKIVGSFKTDELRMYIGQGNEAALSKAKGLGKKGAQKIVAALKESYEKYLPADQEPLPDDAAIDKMSKVLEGVKQGLINLGYSATEAKNKISGMPHHSEDFAEGSIEESITKELSNLLST